MPELRTRPRRNRPHIDNANPNPITHPVAAVVKNRRQKKVCAAGDIVNNDEAGAVREGRAEEEVGEKVLGE